MVKCKICNKEIGPNEDTTTVKGFVFHAKCFSEVSDTYRNSKTLQKLVNFAFRKFPGVR
jgi:hypothetical protein